MSVSARKRSSKPSAAGQDSERKNPRIARACRYVLLSGLAAIGLYGGGSPRKALAGDLLRGGYTSSGHGSIPGSFTPPSVAQAQKNAHDMLSRTTQAIQAVTAMQSAARKIALAGGNGLTISGQTLPNVSNGLGGTGLVPVNGLTPAGAGYQVPSGWSGVGSLNQTQTSGATTVTITQNKPDAILTWSSFNVGKETTLDFDQRAGRADESTWIAFNLVQGTTNPAQILGSIKAGGQVYVIDQNGIIFGGSSLVNVHTLVASSLPINTYLIGHGLLNNPDDQFLFSAFSQPAGTNGSPAFTPPAAPPNGIYGDVTVQAGAQITAPADADNVGGRVALVGPNVTNDGAIYTPDGQTILAAGLQVAFAAHPSNDPTLRGLDVYIGAVTGGVYPKTATAGLAENNGLISVPSGDITIAGATVDQLGVLESTTTVNLNGRIDLLADFGAVTSSGITGASGPFLNHSTGTVLLGDGSVTQIMPDYASADTVTAAQFSLNSEVNVQGLAIHMAGDAAIFSPSGSVNLNAGQFDSFVSGGIPGSVFDRKVGQIYLDSGAAIDVQGSWDVSVPVSQNIIAVQLLGPQLADSPLQRTGPFRGQTIYVDIRDNGYYNGLFWQGTPLADTSGYVGLVPYTIGELTTQGGSVNLAAGASVVMQPGSQVNVSGGWIDYTGGTVTESEVVTDGHIYPISKATPDLVYNGFNLGTFTVDHLKYGLAHTYTDPLITNSHYEAGYDEGSAGGNLSITAPSTALDGQLIGLTVVGPRQLQMTYTADSPAPSPGLPLPSRLELTYQGQTGSTGAVGPAEPALPPNIIFSSANTLLAVAPFALDSNGNPLALSADRQQTVILSPDLVGSDGFGALNINDGDGNITVPSNVTLKTGPEGSITLASANIDIEGSIIAPGGALNFTTYDYEPLAQASQLPQTPAYNPARGDFTLGSTSSLSTAGLIIDDRAGVPDANTQPVVTAGGSVSVASLVVDMENGSSVNVSGGVEMQTSGKPAYGNAGSIKILAGEDPHISSIPGGKLTMDASLLGFSGATGGSVTLRAPLIQIGGDSTNPDTLLISPSFFDQGGFSSFTLDGIGEVAKGGGYLPAVDIAPGAVIDPVVTSMLAVPSGADLTFQPVVLPAAYRAPVTLSFNAPGLSDAVLGTGVIRGDLLMGAGATIQAGLSGNVSFNGQTVAILGDIFASGGTITLTAGDVTTLNSGTPQNLPTLDIGPRSIISAAGTTVFMPDIVGETTYQSGKVLPGGSISLTGNIVAEAGSVLDVSGATGVLALSPYYSNISGYSGVNTALAIQNGSLLGAVPVETRVDSNGGTITLTGVDDLFSEATLKGQAGGPSATGGTLIVSSGLSLTVNPPSVPTLTVTQNGSSIPVADFYPAGQDAIGHAVIGTDGKPIAPTGYFAVNSFTSGGFGSLDLKGSVLFQGLVDIEAAGSLIIATGGLIQSDSKVTLQAPYVALGQPFQPPNDTTAPFTYNGGTYDIAPRHGTGSLTVIASLIDIGNLTLQHIGTADFMADGGSIRGDGTLDVAGKILMESGQVYTPTESTFTIAAYDYTQGSTSMPGTVTFVASGNVETPLSAGGVLNVYASDINQDGVLRVPGGTINLGYSASGQHPIDPITGAAFDPAQSITLSAGSITSVSEIDSLTGQPLVIPFGINYNGTSWIDPGGTDITTGGVPQKKISIAGATVVDEKGATVDIRGGGDLLAYQFVPSILGSNDILASSASFAIIPGYEAGYAPYAPYNPLSSYYANGSDPGYTNSKLQLGQQIYLSGEGSLAAGTYTLLPARYALLPGAFLVTPTNTSPVGDEALPDGSYVVSGYKINPFQGGQDAQPLYTSYNVESGAVLNQRAQYNVSLASQFLYQGAVMHGATVPRLPQDSGQLVFNATQGLTISGALEAQSISGGLGGLVDISTPSNIIIGGPGVTTTAPNTIVLDANVLDSFGAASLLIGGTRTINGDNATVTVSTGNITVNNPGDALTGDDIILVSKGSLTLDQGAEVESSGPSSGAEAITLNGNGALLRVSGDLGATVTRTGVTSGNTAELTVDAKSKLKGGSAVLDSSGGAYLDPAAIIQAQSVALDSGGITFELTNPGANAPVPTATSGLILSGNALQTLFGSAQSVSLLSYSDIGVYGTGSVGGLDKNGEALLDNLSFHSGEILGFNSTGGSVVFNAKNILLDNSGNAKGPLAAANGGGTLTFNGDTIALGANQLQVGQFSALNLTASGGVIANTTGALSVAGPLTITAPVITGAKGASETITSTGDLSLQAPAKGVASVTGGLGASLTFVGSTMEVNSDIPLPGGNLLLEAKTGDLQIGNAGAATLDVGGQSKTFFDLTKYTSGGEITLIADQGNISVGSTATVNVAAQSGGGNAGALSVTAANGTVALDGKLLAQGGAGGKSGSFSLDVNTLQGDANDSNLPSLLSLDANLNTARFDQSRTIEVRNGDVYVDGLATAATFNLAANSGDIFVSGEVDASGKTGGAITLQAAGSVTLLSGAELTVAADNYNSAQKGGSVSLEAGADINGVASSSAVVDIQTGSTINLSVAANPTAGDLAGTLLLRAPQNATSTDLQVNAINGTILGASSITAEGYAIFDTSGDNGSIDDQKGNVYDNGQTFAGNTAAISSRLLANNSGLAGELVVAPGAEIINASGDLELAYSWDLSSYRYGPNNVAGDLALRASGNVIFDYEASLSDGFTGATAYDILLPVGSTSYSYEITAGADFSSANLAAVRPLSNLGANSGSILIGQGAPPLPTDTDDNPQDVVYNYFQTIRTGVGNISLSAGRDVQLLDTLATVYTAGTQAPALANFQLPNTIASSSLLGSVDYSYPAQYSYEGGNISIAAQNNITHLVLNSSGQLVADSSLEMPTTWLDRMGYVNPVTGQFAPAVAGNPIAATSWWVDFSSFFEGVGALGGGNVSMIAGNSVTNVDAVVPTNARMSDGTPNAANRLELGGGDLLVKAGADINGGVYYVERGNGVLSAGDQILTNSTRATLLVNATKTQHNYSGTWLPTTLFIGDGTFNVNASGSVLLGSVANPFLLPQDIQNSYRNKTYFSTYGLDDSVEVSSLNGNVSIRASGALGTLQAFYQNILLAVSNNSYAATSQPWLRIDEATLGQVNPLIGLMPSTLDLTSFSGNVNIAGDLTLSPSPTGTIQIAAAGAINGLQPTAVSLANGNSIWTEGVINVSDADPSLIPGVASPLGFPVVVSAQQLAPVDALFAESGSVEGAYGVIQTKESLHAAGLLHATDTVPDQIYANSGNISGFTLFSPKVTQVISGLDLTDFSLYIQNDQASDITVVSAGRDIIPYDPSSLLRQVAASPGNAIVSIPGQFLPGSGNPNAGDIQIAGPGTLEVLAGRNLTAGVGPNASDGTAVGITSIGNAANPYLPFEGSQIIAAAGLGDAAIGLDNSSSLDLQDFASTVLSSAAGAVYFADLAATENLNVPDYAAYKQLDNPAQKQLQAIVGLDLFYLVLRDAGRDHNLAKSPGFGNYAAGMAAIQALLRNAGSGTGNIDLTSKEIKTESGGDIDILAPSGQLTVGVDLAGNQPVDQGILTDDGGNISIYTQGDVTVGTSRIFTLRGGNEIIWSTGGNIAAGESAKTVQSAPPTRVIVDPQSANVSTDLAGLGTGGGIGVLAAVAGVPAGSVDLIAPTGVIDAGDAGIRATGNLNLAAVQVLNAANIQAGGASTGVPTVTVSAPNLGALATASAVAGAGAQTAEQQTAQQSQDQQAGQTGDSVISVDVIGYGGGEGDDSGG